MESNGYAIKFTDSDGEEWTVSTNPPSGYIHISWNDGLGDNVVGIPWDDANVLITSIAACLAVRRARVAAMMENETNG